VETGLRSAIGLQEVYKKEVPSIPSMVWCEKHGNDAPSHSALTSGIGGLLLRLLTHEH